MSRTGPLRAMVNLLRQRRSGGDAEAIALWLEAGAIRPNQPEYAYLDIQTYLRIAKLIREGWWRKGSEAHREAPAD